MVLADVTTDDDGKQQLSLIVMASSPSLEQDFEDAADELLQLALA